MFRKSALFRFTSHDEYRVSHFGPLLHVRLSRVIKIILTYLLTYLPTYLRLPVLAAVLGSLHGTVQGSANCVECWTPMTLFFVDTKYTGQWKAAGRRCLHSTSSNANAMNSCSLYGTKQALHQYLCRVFPARSRIRSTRIQKGPNWTASNGHFNSWWSQLHSN